MNQTTAGRARWRVVVPTLAMLLVAAAAAGPASQAQPPVFGAGVELVRLDVIVLDHDGRPVRGLAASDFTLEEDGRPQAITSFEPVVVTATAPAPAVVEPPRVTANRTRSPQDGRCVFLFFNDVHLTAPVAEHVRVALRRYIDNEVR